LPVCRSSVPSLYYKPPSLAGAGTHLGSVKDSSDASGDSAAKQTDHLQGSVLLDLGHALLMHHSVLREGRCPHLFASTIP
jgi:hypothetical protein